MALAVGAALLEAARPYTVTSLEEPLRRAFIAWNESPDNNRAPGRTCVRACANLARNLPWYEATVLSSKGCGANMRVASVGLLPPGEDDLTASTRAAIAQFQAALTHGHPTALAATDLTTATIADLVAGVYPAVLPGRIRRLATSV